MKKKVYYKLNRYQVTKVEVETAEQEQAVKMLNRDTDRFAKSEDTYRERYASLDEMYEETGYEPADDNPNPEEQFIESERQAEIKKQVHKALRQLNPRQQAMVQMVFFEDKSQDEVAEYFGISKQAVSNAMQRIYAALKKILEKKLRFMLPDRVLTPRNFPIVVRGYESRTKNGSQEVGRNDRN